MPVSASQARQAAATPRITQASTRTYREQDQDQAELHETARYPRRREPRIVTAWPQLVVATRRDQRSAVSGVSGQRRQVRDDGGLLVVRRPAERGPVVLAVADVGARAELDQERHQLEVAGPRRLVHRRPSDRQVELEAELVREPDAGGPPRLDRAAH